MHEKLYKEYRNEVGIAISSFLLWKKIEEYVADKKKLSRLNFTPLSWTVIRHSLQVTCFITLYRIFETDEGCISADDLLKTYIKDLSVFNKEELKMRKDPKGENPNWLGEYIDCAYEPSDRDFQCLRSELSKRRKIFNKIYRPIRSKLIAHKVKTHIDKATELYALGDMNELEEILEFLHALKEALFDLYINGREPDLSQYRINKLFYREDYNRLMKKATGL